MRTFATRRALAALLAVLTMAVGMPARAQTAGHVTILVLSNRADLISGGNALVEAVLPTGTDVAGVRVDVDGRDVTDSFAVRADGRYLGRVEGLALGANTLRVTLADGSGARITITNHPIGGPVFSGPQIQPWTCAEGAVDSQCNRETTYEFLYRSSAPGSSGFESYDAENPPSDVAETTTDEGVTVPYIIRLETGAIDRDEYRIAVLYDPEQPWEPWAAQEQFNHKLLITHGASCDTSYEQGSAPDVLDDVALSRGFIVMSHALNNAGHNCNIVTQAESMIMTKEHLVERYGELRYTIGTGCSGGSQVQQQVANAFPGFYQGILPACSFPDSWSGKMLYEDYSLLRRYFEDPSKWEPGVAWTEDDVAATWGHPSHVNAITYNTAIAPTLDPSRPCPGVADEDVYDAQTNPGGVRCSQHDYMVNEFGRREVDGFANRPHDSVGVQYGLRALQEGEISPAQFVDVNEKVGARDIDYEPIPERVAADIPALSAAYRSGAVNTASNLDQVAIIDLRGPDPGAFHDVYRTYAMRARLEREHGDADNQVLWRGTVPLFGDATFVDAALLVMDEWLTAVEADSSDLPLADKIVANKPDSASHRCTDGAGHDYDSQQVCNELVDSYSTARIEAGMPFTDDVLKCQLKPLRQTDYLPVRFTDEEWATLQAVFPDGVCDYSKPGVEQQDTVPWMTFADGPGGRPMGDPPVSVPFAPGAGGAVVERHRGPGRVETAVAVSGRGRDAAETVVLARADEFADALTGGPLAVALDAPLLLTSSDRLSDAAAAEIRRLGATRAVLLGGAAALSEAVADDVSILGVTAQRVSGANRYATAAAIAQHLDGSEVFVANGNRFADALAASGLASTFGHPILLATAEGLPAETAAALDPGAQAVLVGGDAVLGEAAAAAVGERVAGVRRLSGTDRYATSAAVARDALGRGVDPGVVWVATGADFADALVAGAAAGRDDGWLVLVDGADLATSAATRDLLVEQRGAISTLRIAGGPDAVSTAVEEQLRALLEEAEAGTS